MILIRGSELGACSKGTIAKLLGMKPIAHSEATERLFREGNLHEEDVIVMLRAEGLKIVRQQEEVNLQITPGALVQGHLDGVVTGDPFTPVGPRVLEIKSMGASSFKEFKTKGWEAGGLVDRYKYQISSYMLATGLEALVVAKSRDSGELLRFGVELPFYSLDQITERVAYIEDHVARGQLPDDCPHDFWCSFRYLCQGNREATETTVDKVIDSLAVEYLTAVQISKQADDSKNAARKKLEEVLGTRATVRTNAVVVSSYEQLSPPKLNLEKFQTEGLNADDYYLPRTKSRRIKVTAKEVS